MEKDPEDSSGSADQILPQYVPTFITTECQS